MFHPADDFLADVATFPEVHGAELVEVGFVRESIDRQVIAPPFGDAQRNPSRVIGGRFALPEMRRCSPYRLRGAIEALAERGIAGVGEGVEILAGDRGGIKAGDDCGFCRQEIDRNCCPKPVLREFAGEFFRKSTGDIDEIERFIVTGVKYQHIRDDLTLRGQERCKPARTGRQPRDIRRQEIAEEMVRVRAGNGNECTFLQPDRGRRGGGVRGG